ncbi:uncharacterized protein LOC100568880 isoform X2 [Acyrthosiphon pisum]|nr:uncharacterized protein LOC100568880 isoform X2 [Acyrthosiphon pisum]XP_016655934.1 uncharacterized protein LOC100568880 isoform X2 [Acyrthosiphon pisum]|eukprot:XP_016655928.1 PREDICTED: uncharacterized protein LOC100568880 isoform X2 [Acyrthosiphon pisum]
MCENRVNLRRSHSNIEGNEKVDCLPKEAANSTNLEISEKYCTYEDTLRCINTAIEEKWSLKWRRKETKLSEIKRTTDRWKNKSNLNRKEEVILTRLRIGHTRYTLHGYLMSREDQPTCATCGVHLTIKHILVECRQTEAARTKYSIPEFLYQSLGPNESAIKQTLNLIKELEIENLL